MPSLNYSQAMTANQAGLNPLTSWQFETIPQQWPRGAYCRLLVNATTAGVRLTVYSGSQTIQQRAPVTGGGTAGTIPAALNVQPIEWIASPGDRVMLLHDEVLGGTPTVNGVIIVDPV